MLSYFNDFFSSLFLMITSRMNISCGFFLKEMLTSLKRKFFFKNDAFNTLKIKSKLFLFLNP